MFCDLDPYGLLVGLDANIMHDMKPCMIHRLHTQKRFLWVLYMYILFPALMQDVLYDVNVPKSMKCLGIRLREYYKFKTGIRITQHHCRRFSPSEQELFVNLAPVRVGADDSDVE